MMLETMAVVVGAVTRVLVRGNGRYGADRAYAVAMGFLTIT